MKNFYAFKFTDGINTTTGNGKYFRSAGQLFKFKKAADRDLFVGDSTFGNIIHSVKRSEIPHGHKAVDAVELVAHNGGYKSHQEIALTEYYSLAE